MTEPRYYVLTWDTDKQMFTPQRGVRAGPWSKWELRLPLRALGELGYDVTRAGGYSVLVQRANSVKEIMQGYLHRQGKATAEAEAQLAVTTFVDHWVVDLRRDGEMT